MYHFILPLTIESRKIIFLDLRPIGTDLSETDNPGEDQYIIEIPQQEKSKIITLSLDKTMQSLFKDYDDAPLRSLQFSFTEVKSNFFELNLSEKQAISEKGTVTEEVNNAVEGEELPLSNGLTLQLNKKGTEITLLLIKDYLIREIENDCFTVRVKYKTGKLNCQALLKFYIADKTKIQFTGLDFGSEACQMWEGNYDKTKSGISYTPVDLFSSIKSNFKLNENDDYYEQFEKDSYLFNSVFYSNKSLVHNSGNQYLSENNLWSITDGLHILTKWGDVNAGDFLTGKVQVPNLKIIHGSSDFANKINFKIKNGEVENNETLSNIKLKDSIYAGLLQKMVTAYIEMNISELTYIHFTLLVPNIYDIHEISKLKKITRCILNTANKRKYLKGIEISTVSESDASFLGCLKQEQITAGNYYIIIDCGKGTTDFSIIQSDKNNQSTYKPLYRNGFAGAGNLVSFAIMQSVFYYLLNLKSANDSNMNSKYETNLNEFIKQFFPDGQGTQFKRKFFKIIEEWKKGYTSNKTKTEIEKIWTENENDNNSIFELFASTKPSADQFLSAMGKIKNVYDWGGYIEKTLAEMTARIQVNLDLIVRQLNSNRSKCDGLILTGRGFLFKPLRKTIVDSIRCIKGMNKVPVIKISDDTLKEICMKGIFEHNIKLYSDIASTPFENKKGFIQQIRKRDTFSKNPIRRLIQKIEIINENTRFGWLYDEEKNELPILNFDDLKNAQFFASGKFYQFGYAEVIDAKSAILLLSREGLFIKITEKNENKIIVQLKETEIDSSYLTDNKANIIKSLYPALLDKSLLFNLKN